MFVEVILQCFNDPGGNIVFLEFYEYNIFGIATGVQCYYTLASVDFDCLGTNVFMLGGDFGWGAPATVTLRGCNP
jgi:hypothetical protein